VNSSQGGGSKDTWILEGDGTGDGFEPVHDVYNPPTMPGMRQAGWAEQQRQQQQERGR